MEYWYYGAVFAVHANMKIQTGVVLTMVRVVMQTISMKHKINT